MRTSFPLWSLAMALVALVSLPAGPCHPADAAAYVVGPGDTLDVRVTGAPDLPSATAIVRPDGAISFPHVGDIRVAGKKVPEVAAMLTEALLKRYRTIAVTVSVTQFRERTALVLGQVQKPGPIPLSGEALPLRQAILEAGGLGAEVTTLDARLYRPGQTPVPVDLRKVMNEGTTDTVLAVGDTLVVEARKPEEITLLGELQKPGIYPIPPGARLDTLLALGATPTERGDARRAMLVRSDGQATIIDVAYLLANPDSPANVPLAGARLFVVPPKAEIVVGGEVKTPGAYPAGSQTKLFDILTAAGGLTEKADGRTVTVVNREGTSLKVDAVQALAHPESAANVPVSDVSVIVVGQDTRRYEVGMLGEFGSPQEVEVRDSIPLAAALTKAGGLSEKADPRRVQILRSDGTQEVVDVTALLGRRDPTAPAPAVAGIALRPGDLVIASRRYAEVLVLGAVGSPGPYEFKEGDRVIDVIGRAGGFAEKAVKKRTTILRRQGDVVQVISLDMKAAMRGSETLLVSNLQDHDIILVPKGALPVWTQLAAALFGIEAVRQVFLR